jgi:hypothetical protein
MLVEYKLLLKGRSFIFNSEYTIVYYIVIIAKIAKVVTVRNTIYSIVKIPKRTLVGKIGESYNSGFFVYL